MTPELEKKLFDKYPNLYGDRSLPAEKSCMCWRLSVRDGWYDILDRLSAKLEPMGIKAAQVKEKFGGLRFYIYGGENLDEAEGYVQEAEAEAAKTCEQCGAPGMLYGGGWLTTLCETCAKKRGLSTPHKYQEV